MNKTKMLRDWNAEPNELISSMLGQFGIQPDKIMIFKYEALSPDSFIWCLNVKKDDSHDRYFLYAEDYVPNLDHVKMAIKDNLTKWNPADTVELMPVTKRIDWNESDPVSSAESYRKPERPEEFMEYAATSGFDFVFFAKVVNKPV